MYYISVSSQVRSLFEFYKHIYSYSYILILIYSYIHLNLLILNVHVLFLLEGIGSAHVPVQCLTCNITRETQAGKKKKEKKEECIYRICLEIFSSS